MVGNRLTSSTCSLCITFCTSRTSAGGSPFPVTRKAAAARPHLHVNISIEIRIA
jgi:hypothetical protein